MDNVKNDSYYIAKIKTDLAFIRLHTECVSYEAFIENEILQDSMMFRLVQISENSKRISETFKTQHGEIPWADILGLRNRIVHEYGNADMHIVYDTLIIDIPDLLEKM